QSGHRGRLGNGRTTGHQNSSDAPKKQACSTLCQIGERRVRSNAAGTCQAHSVMAVIIQQLTGCVSLSEARRNAGQTRKGPTPSRANFLGNPRSKGRSGPPSRIRGGATDKSNKCCTIWAESKKEESASRGEATASQRDATPPMNANKRQVGNRSGEVRCK